MSIIHILDLVGTAAFAASGAWVGVRKKMDLFGVLVLGSVTAVGGGTLRDVLLDRTPLWIAQPGFVAVATLAAVVVFFTAHLLESRYRALLWLDSLALAVAVPAGAGVAISLAQPWPVTLIMGTLTGTFGGMMRDVVCNEVPLVLKKGELYVTAAFAGSAATVLAASMVADPLIVAVAGGLVTWALRAGSLMFGWSLPSYKSRPPRP